MSMLETNKLFKPRTGARSWAAPSLNLSIELKEITAIDTTGPLAEGELYGIPRGG